MYDHQGKIKEPNIAAEVGQGLFGIAKSYAQKDMGGMFKGAMGLFKTATGNTQKAEEYSRKTRTSAADAVSLFLPSLYRRYGYDCSRVSMELELQISWSGCKDTQTSADTVEAGQATGAMSHAFVSALSAWSVFSVLTCC